VHRVRGEREIICAFRPGDGIRLGPHFYNTDAELEHVSAEIRGILATGAHRRWLDVAARF
jgi:selenocysteine lyase/cysteine desulfurase